MADGLVARQTQASIDVLCRADDAFFGRSLQGSSGVAFLFSLSNDPGEAGRLSV
jgi:hypothetical protein